MESTGGAKVWGVGDHQSITKGQLWENSKKRG